MHDEIICSPATNEYLPSVFLEAFIQLGCDPYQRSSSSTTTTASSASALKPVHQHQQPLTRPLLARQQLLMDRAYARWEARHDSWLERVAQITCFPRVIAPRHSTPLIDYYAA